jgi:gluconolactonase
MSALAHRSRFLIRDPRFEDALGKTPTLECVAEVDAHEGPVYVASEDALYFTTVRRESVAIKRLALANGEVTVVREDANHANGMTLDREGRLLICEQGTLSEPARISRLDLAKGTLETIADSFARREFNSPNDVVSRSDGTVWFTDPSYGFLQDFRPAPSVPDRVYRVDPRSGQVAVAAEGFDKPNGLAFAPDEHILYVADNGAPHHLVAFDVGPDGCLSGRRLIAVGTPGHPDGLKVDAAGRIYASALDGIQVFDPRGDLIGEIDLPGTVNFTFGGPERNVLYITTDTAVWAAVLQTKGA